MLRNEGTLPLPARQYARSLELAHRSADRGNSDAVAARELGLNRDLGSRPPFAGGERLNQLLLHFAVKGKTRCAARDRDANHSNDMLDYANSPRQTLPRQGHE